MTDSVIFTHHISSGIQNLTTRDRIPGRNSVSAAMPSLVIAAARFHCLEDTAQGVLVS